MSISDSLISGASDQAATHIAFRQSNANALRALDLPHGIQMRQYSNAHEHLYYEEEKIHTFSLYLQGGFQTHRTDTSSTHGAPGRFCLMPAGSYSAWHVGCEQQFMHIYFDDAYIKRLALQNFDVDPRLLSLPHLTFQDSDSLFALAKHSLLNQDWSQAGNQMFLQHSLQSILLNLLQTIGVKGVDTHSQLPVKAGLSPYTQKQLKAYIQAQFQRQIYLSELAAVAGLSEYHFARMFKVSFAETPQNYISNIRIEQLKHRLKTAKNVDGLSMAQLALEYGFSSQSHMGRVFKQHVGISPGQFSKLA